MENIILNLYLVVGAIKDIKEKRVSFSYLYIGIMISIGFIILQYQQKELRWYHTIFSCLPGLFFLLYGKCTGGKIGYGDGLVLIMMGICHSYQRTWFIWCLAIVFMTLFSGFLFCIKRVSRNTKIPFLPFLWMADFILWFSG